MLSQSFPIYFYAFDILNQNGGLLVNLPLSHRHELLESLLSAPKYPVRLSPLLQGPSRQILEAVRKLGLEGVVGKRIGSIYEPGERSGAWIKHCTNREQDFVIGGYIPGGRGFDALLVGVCENKELIFVAKVKHGFVQRIRDEVFPALKALQSAQCPFRNLPEKWASRWGESLTAEKMNQCRWVKPKLICRVAFAEWTDAGHLRHCTFVAIRDDKKYSPPNSGLIASSAWSPSILEMEALHDRLTSTPGTPLKRPDSHAAILSLGCLSCRRA
jgi:ATP-dependent DNA ligase